MHTGVSGVRALPREDRRGGDRGRPALPLLHADQLARDAATGAPGRARGRPGRHRRSSPADEKTSFDIKELIGALVDAGSFCEVHARWAKELVVGYARLDGRAIGIVANQPRQKGGVLFVDSADKAARFIMTCNAFNIPLLFLADVPGFMIGTAVERQGIIRHGAKMISAVSEATVPKISVIVRKAYGAGLYAMAGPAFEPDCCIALPGASIAVMGPEAAINAVFFNQIQAIEDEAEREQFVKRQARRVLGRHRHPAPRLGDGDRRRDRARHAARGADPPVRPRRGRVAPLLRAAQPDHPGLAVRTEAKLARPEGGESRASCGSRNACSRRERVARNLSRRGLEHDSGLHPRERSADAVMDPLAKAQIPFGFASDIEEVGLIESPLIAIGRPVEDVQSVSAGMSTPAKDVSVAVTRLVTCSGESKRRTTSMAAGSGPDSRAATRAARDERAGDRGVAHQAGRGVHGGGEENERDAQGGRADPPAPCTVALAIVLSRCARGLLQRSSIRSVK